MRYDCLIPGYNLEWLQEKLGKLNRRADKLGVPRVNAEISGEPTELRKIDGRPLPIPLYSVTLIGETVKLSGWTLVAIAEYSPGGEILLRCVPGEECPERYRQTSYFCDHCQTTRKRSAVFIVRHEDGTHKQVGRNCLKDFLGHTSPEHLAQWAELLWDLTAELGEGNVESYGHRAEFTVRTPDFLAATAAIIRRLGWVPRSAEDNEKTATVQNVWYFVIPPRAMGYEAWREWVEFHNIAITDEDRKLAESTLQWATGLSGTGSNYLENLGVTCRSPYINHRIGGIAASAIMAYRKHCEAELARKSEAKPVSGHVGAIGERREFNVVCHAMREFYSQYGVKTMLRFTDDKGNVIVWWSSGDCRWIEQGGSYRIVATVAKHSEYRGTKQTEIKRAKPV